MTDFSGPRPSVEEVMAYAKVYAGYYVALRAADDFTEDMAEKVRASLLPEAAKAEANLRAAVASLEKPPEVIRQHTYEGVCMACGATNKIIGTLRGTPLRKLDVEQVARLLEQEK